MVGTSGPSALPARRTRRALIGAGAGAGAAAGLALAGCGETGSGGRGQTPAGVAGSLMFWHWGSQDYFVRYRTLADEWAYATAWSCNDERTAALDSWLEHYNTALSHFALGGRPPISRLAA